MDEERAERAAFFFAFGLFAMMHDEYDPFDPWAGRAEKSSSAQHRENAALAKFERARRKVENAIVNNKVRVVQLGCKPGSNSPFLRLPEVAVEHIFEFLRGEKKVEADGNETTSSMAAVGTTGATATEAFHVPDRASLPSATANKAFRDPKRASLPTVRPVGDGATESDTKKAPLDLKSLYIPGNKIVIPLTKPNCHLTAPCWRDFGRAVRQHEGWNVKRIAATPEQKREYRETRNGKVYFINAVYTVPGDTKKSSAAKKKKKTVEETDSKMPATKKAKRTDEE